MSSQIIKFDIHINEPTEMEKIYKLVSVIKPFWKLNDLKFHVFKEGITNKLFAVSTQKELSEDSCILIRIYGPDTELYIDRLREDRYLFLLNKVGFSNQVFATFANGICYGYTSGFVPDYEDVISSISFHLIPEKMAEMHNLPLAEISNMYNLEKDFEIDTTPNLLRMFRKFISLLPDAKDSYPADLSTKESLQEEAIFLENLLRDTTSPIGLCHNDLLLGNIIMSRNRDAVSFIDFEYCSYNYTAFDIANHFCEYTVVNSTELDHSRYPTIEHQRFWLKIYLQASSLLSNTNFGSDEDDNEVVLDSWIEEIKKFSLASQLVYGTWGLVQSFKSNIDFNFKSYGMMRINEYFRLKENLN